ncbi:hypothetical protein [Terribacillus saccharophilus]|uniref:hypothetical protein n=1 Tax=Terribacillus saccharophilus TaxID=361277 RepID=UPI001595F677|nr:hypothetical protein [Terribacillus saccharophilus]
MDMDLIQAMLDIVFKGNLLYLTPVLFVVMVVLFAERLIELVVMALGSSSGGRRNRY